MAELKIAGALDVSSALREERAVFLELLHSLNGADWDSATECPAWTVKGIALHILGDDLSLLSRQRDAATSGLVLLAQDEPGLDFRGLLDAFNERWVHLTGFISVAVLIELLELTGELTADFYATVDPELVGAPVGLFGPEPAPYWKIAAREYAERWIHHLQIARATSRSGPVESSLLLPAVATFVRGFPLAMSDVAAESGDSVTVVLNQPAAAWTLTKAIGGWILYHGSVSTPTAQVEISAEVAALLFSGGLDRETALSSVHGTGDSRLCELVINSLATSFAGAC